MDTTIDAILTLLRAQPAVTAAQLADITAILHAPPGTRELSERQAAGALGVSVMTLNRWRRGMLRERQRFPFNVRRCPITGRIRYSAAEIAAHAAAASAGTNHA